MRAVIFAAIVFGGTVSSALAAPSFVLCTAADKDDIVLEIDAAEFAGRKLSCLRGGDGFYADMTPCAPDGGFGLSAPTGAADLVSVVDDWRDYGDHLGGVVTFGSSDTNYWFQGGFMGPDGYREVWTFDVSRLTGEGDLSIVQEVEEDGAVGRSLDTYACAAATQKF